MKLSKIEKPIGYVGVMFSSESNRLLNQILKDLGLQKDFNDNFHCTIAYSKKNFKFKLPNENENTVKIKDDQIMVPVKEQCSIKGFGNFKTNEGLNLHIELNCLFCKSEFNRCIKSGAVYDYNKYIPHITLMYNCALPGEDKGIPMKYFKNTLDKYIGKKLTIVREYKQVLNKDWLKDAK